MSECDIFVSSNFGGTKKKKKKRTDSLSTTIEKNKKQKNRHPPLQTKAKEEMLPTVTNAHISSCCANSSDSDVILNE